MNNKKSTCSGTLYWWILLRPSSTYSFWIMFGRNRNRWKSICHSGTVEIIGTIAATVEDVMHASVRSNIRFLSLTNSF